MQAIRGSNEGNKPSNRSRKPVDTAFLAFWPHIDAVGIASSILAPRTIERTLRNLAQSGFFFNPGGRFKPALDPTLLDPTLLRSRKALFSVLDRRRGTDGGLRRREHAPFARPSPWGLLPRLVPRRTTANGRADRQLLHPTRDPQPTGIQYARACLLRFILWIDVKKPGRTFVRPRCR